MEIKNTPDNRSYFASFDKIYDVLHFKTKHNVKEASKEIFVALQNGKLDYGDKTITLKWYNHIRNNPDLLIKYSINDKFL